MSEITQLESYVYDVLLHATNGWSEEELREALHAEKLTPERIDFVLKVAADIMDIAFDHAEPLKDLLLDEDATEDEARENVKTYLQEREVREEYIEPVITYNHFIYAKAAAETLIIEGRNKGQSERKIKGIIKEAMDLDHESTEQIYEAAVAGIAEAKKTTALPGPEGKPKSVIAPALRGVVLIAIGFINYKAELTTDWVHFFAFGMGLIYLIIAMSRYGD